MPEVRVRSLGPRNARSTLTTYRLQGTVQEEGLLLAVALHVDLAEEAGDAALVMLLENLLSTFEPRMDAEAAPSALLGALHEHACGSGRYLSAAAMAWRGPRFQLARCGLAALVEQRSRQVVLAPEIRMAGRVSQLANVLGWRAFQAPPDVELPGGGGRHVLSVGGAAKVLEGVDPLSGLPPPSDPPRDRGGLVIAFA